MRLWCYDGAKKATMEIDYRTDDAVTPEEMQALEEAVGFGPHRNLDRNRQALAGSLFLATARCGGRLVGLVRLVGDGAYVLHVAGLSVHPDFQRQGIGRQLMEMAIAFARQVRVGSGTDVGEFTLFANTGADRFYEKMGFSLIPNGMVLTDTDLRRRLESRFVDEWTQRRSESSPAQTP
jgi:GNAT superfamily N-acetyltransferase